jgi:glucose-1-phosphate cytidylyltransferase
VSLPPVVILCGGRGTRLQEHAADLPKPLVEIGGRPILWHVMQLYLTQGARRFVLAAGHRGEMIAAFTQAEAAAGGWPADARVDVVDTGADTATGGRIRRVRDRLGDGTFMATYADGVADVDLAGLLARHREHAAAATVTLVRPQLPFGVAVLDGADVVTGFREKPRSEHWINGGFFCFEPAVFDVLTDDDPLEGRPLERLAAGGALRGFRHTGFWACMDTYKDAVRLNDLWAAGSAPWKLW